MKLLVRVTLALVIGLIASAAWLYTPDRSRAELEARYLRAPADIIEVGDTVLHVRDSGAVGKPAVILLHGFGASLHTWEPWVRGLESDMRVIRFDLPGLGLSPPDVTGEYSDERSLALVAALMDRLSLPAASLVGNSMGGRIAWRFAAQFPDRVEKLVLISPDGFASPGLAYGRAPDVPVALQAMQFALPKWMLKANLAVAYADPSKLDDATLTRYHDLMLAPGARTAMLSRMAQLILADPTPLLPLIRARTLLVWGEKDAMIPVGNAKDYQRLLARSQLVVFPSLGHVPHEEAPEVSLPAVKRFLLGE